jgi:hypothetical protein
MAKISVEGSPVGPDLGIPVSVSGHLLLVFTDDAGTNLLFEVDQLLTRQIVVTSFLK